MHLNPPNWWSEKKHILSKLVRPVGVLYGQAVERRWKLTSPYQSVLPVICIGNLTVGGAGKTPTAMAIAERLLEKGEKPAFLTRGYKGKHQGPHLVDQKTDTAEEVGDEALLLAKIAPTIVAKNRPNGAQFIEAHGSTVIIMDDGFQNPTLHKDFSLAVIDGQTGVGNGEIFPAGPLRASLPFQLDLADAILSIGKTTSEETALILLGIAPKNPFFRGILSPTGKSEKLKGTQVLAYSGIGRPEKFFETLEKLGANIVKREPFPDHYNFSVKDAERLLSAAKDSGATLVTTQKDLVRLNGATGLLKKLAKKSVALPVKLTFKEGDDERLLDLITKKIGEKRQKNSDAE